MTRAEDWDADRRAWNLTPEQYVHYLRRLRRHAYEQLMRQEQAEDRVVALFWLCSAALAVAAGVGLVLAVAWLVGR